MIVNVVLMVHVIVGSLPMMSPGLAHPCWQPR
jgi:hypothetical protein